MMVKEISFGNGRAYQCSICMFVYKEKELAIKCEKFCKKNNACSIEITKYAINQKGV